MNNDMRNEEILNINTIENVNKIKLFLYICDLLNSIFYYVQLIHENKPSTNNVSHVYICRIQLFYRNTLDSECF